MVSSDMSPINGSHETGIKYRYGITMVRHVQLSNTHVRCQDL